MLKQVNVNLPSELVRECKHAVIDVDQSLSESKDGRFSGRNTFQAGAGR